jgi:hypothetical protein
MEHIFNIALFFVAIFALCLSVSIVLWFKFFPLVKAVDLELYEKIRFRWKFQIRTSYGEYIFKKGFVDTPNKNIKRYALRLYRIGYIGQWAFNIYLLLMVIVVIIQLTS